MTMKKNIAVILAGGMGSRFGGDTPKQFAKLSGKTVFEHTLSTFEQHVEIDDIIIVCRAEYTYLVEGIVNQSGLKKVSHIVNGGKERSDSTLSALKCIRSSYASQENINLLIHDSVRPFISSDVISECIAELIEHHVVDVAVPCTDTIIKVRNGFISDIPNRNQLYQGQTPQAFRMLTLSKAYERLVEDPQALVTDDCGVVRKYLPDVKIKVVPGDYNNIKITNPHDIQIADILFQLNQKNANATATIDKFNEKVVVIFGGSYGIGASIKDLLTNSGCIVYSFSRTETGHSITNTKAVSNFLDNIFKRHKKIDMIVNTTGSLTKKPLKNISDIDIDEDINVNLISCFKLAKLSFPYLKESKGSLTFFSSSSYSRGRAFYSVYSATKAAIVNLTQALSEEWGVHGIRINCVTPDRTKTPMREKSFGNECSNTLLDPNTVAKVALGAMTSDTTGVNYRCQL
ncbi:2-C-methyl-D-erythritol 4-phosphate cytidylyltransferase [Vibrio sp. Hep-1b-8]|nr:2-C-methyl-D-erythritol 4-phosphate cytidylyltransferase [Vibrio sp. Hep-1b-8]